MLQLTLRPVHVLFRQLYSNTDRNDETKNVCGLSQAETCTCSNKNNEQITSTRFIAVATYLLLEVTVPQRRKNKKRVNIGQILYAQINSDCAIINYTSD
jgi:hypothetical protein